MAMRAHVKTVAARTAVCVLIVFGVIGLAHLPIARAVLMRFEALCPVTRVDPSVVRTLHGTAVAALAGEAATPVTELFGLHWLRAGRADIEAWQTAGGHSCETLTRGYQYVTCTGVPEAVLKRSGPDGATSRTVTLTVDTDGRVVGVDVLAEASPGPAARAVASGAAEALREELGTPSDVQGSMDADVLATPWASARLRYQYRDTVVTLSAIHLAGRGVLVREQYLAAGLAGAAN